MMELDHVTHNPPCSTVKKTSAAVGNRRYYTDKSHVAKQLALKMDNWDNQAQRVKTVGWIPRIQRSTSWWGVMKRRARTGASEPGWKVHHVIYDSINLLSNICLIEMIRLTLCRSWVRIGAGL